jgi:LmbE family N-acetylglucosaminyl deacetylase
MYCLHMTRSIPFHPILVIGRAVLDAVYPLARDRLTFAEHIQEGLEPHVVQSVWLFASACADSYVDITTGFDRKVKARLAHVSQTSDPVALVNGWRERAHAIGAPAELSLAEAFTVLRLE